MKFITPFILFLLIILLSCLRVSAQIKPVNEESPLPDKKVAEPIGEQKRDLDIEPDSEKVSNAMIERIAPKPTIALVIQDTTAKADTIVVEGADSFTWNGRTITFEQDTTNKSYLHNNITLSLGYNFDFLGGISTNELYASLNANFDDVFADPEESRINKLRFGLEGSVSQLRTISISDSIFEEFRDVEPSFGPDSSLQLQYITTSTSQISVQTKENLGSAIQPKITWTPNNSDFLYLIGYLELLRTKNEVVKTRNILNVSSSNEVPDDWPRPYETTNDIPLGSEESRFEYNLNYGLGFGVNVIREVGDLRTRVLFVRNNVQYFENQNANSTLVRNEYLGYIFQLEFFEKKYAGIKIGTELRGSVGSEPGLPALTLEGQLPFFSIYLAKVFSFQKVGSFLSP
ncbi:MAG: hypothetical protein AAFY71_25195 [Bacteroidota bacterium]